MSIRDDLHHLLQRIAAETGDVCEPQPAAGLNTVQDLPEALRSFYSETNGLELPFLKVFSVEQLPHMQGYVLDSSWILFGQDYYFSFYLCAKTPSSDGALITTWDPESDAEVEPTFRTVLELLNDEYEQHITTRLGGIGGAVLSITAMPTSVSLAKLIGSLKVFTAGGSADLLVKLKTLPASIPVTDREAAVKTMREFRGLGVSCTLKASAV